MLPSTVRTVLYCLICVVKVSRMLRVGSEQIYMLPPASVVCETFLRRRHRHTCLFTKRYEYLRRKVLKNSKISSFDRPLSGHMCLPKPKICGGGWSNLSMPPPLPSWKHRTERAAPEAADRYAGMTTAHGETSRLSPPINTDVMLREEHQRQIPRTPWGPLRLL